MLGNSTPIGTTYVGPWQIVEYAWRKQPWTIWKKDHAYFFAETYDEAVNWANRHRSPVYGGAA